MRTTPAFDLRFQRGPSEPEYPRASENQDRSEKRIDPLRIYSH